MAVAATTRQPTDRGRFYGDYALELYRIAKISEKIKVNDSNTTDAAAPIEPTCGALSQASEK